MSRENRVWIASLCLSVGVCLSWMVIYEWRWWVGAAASAVLCMAVPSYCFRLGGHQGQQEFADVTGIRIQQVTR